MYFHDNPLGLKSTRDKSLTRLFKLPAIMAGSLKESNTRWLSADTNELYDRLNLVLQQKEAGNISDTINEEIFAGADKQLQCKCISNKQHRFLLLENLILNEKFELNRSILKCDYIRYSSA